MAEQKKEEFTEEELRNGRPVPPEEAEAAGTDVVPTHSSEDTVVVPAVIEGDLPVDEDPVLIVRPHMKLEPQYLIRYGYLEEIPFAGNRQYVLSADGIRHVAQMMGIKITTCTIVEHEEYWEAESHAVDPHTGASAIGKVRQPKTFGKAKKVDPHAYEKASTRSQRNARRDLIPYKRIVSACIEYMRQQAAQKK